jgi:hypothetical protein
MRKPGWIVLFAVVALVHLLLLAVDATSVNSFSKALLAPVLIGWTLAARGPRLLAVALFFCWLGDIFLELDDAWFVPGMAAFGVAHVCFVTMFVRLGALDGLRARPWIVGAYAVPAAVLVVWAWGGLAPELRVPVLLYAVLLLTTASVAAVVDRLAGLGGLAFLVSDAVIALGEAGRLDGDAVLTKLVIMSLYSVAIALLTAGLLRRAAARTLTA